MKGNNATKDGQQVLLVDARCQYIYNYTLRHKFHPPTPPYNAQGQAEVKRLTDDLAKLIVGNPKPDDN